MTLFGRRSLAILADGATQALGGSVAFTVPYKLIVRYIFQIKLLSEFLIFSLFYSIARKSGVIRHLLGHNLREETDQYDMIALGSLGRVTSVDKNGDFNWQVSYRIVMPFSPDIL